MVVAKLVGDKLNINNPEFIKENLLPDVLNDKEDSHHKKNGKYFLIPDTDYFKNRFDLSDSLCLGYYIHLLLDKYFLEDFVPNNISNLDVFKEKIMYNEYDMVNYELVRRFGLDVPYLKSVLSVYPFPIDADRLKRNLDRLSITSTGETIYLNINDFANFLQVISITICKEVEIYVSKSDDMSICIGQRKKSKYKKK